MRNILSQDDRRALQAARRRGLASATIARVDKPFDKPVYRLHGAMAVLARHEDVEYAMHRLGSAMNRTIGRPNADDKRRLKQLANLVDDMLGWSASRP